MYISLISQRSFITVFLTVTCTTCFLPPTWGHHDTRSDYVVKNHNSQPSQRAETIHNDTSKAGERSLYHREAENSEDQETSSNPPEVRSPHFENRRIPRAGSSRFYPSFETNSLDSDDTAAVEDSKQLWIDDKESKGESEFDDIYASDTDEQSRPDFTNEARFETGGEASDKILRKTSSNDLIASTERQNIISSNRKGHRGVDSSSHTALNLQGVEQRNWEPTVDKDDDVMANTGDASRLVSDYLHGSNTERVSPVRPEQFASDPVAHKDTRIPRFTGITPREHERMADPASLFASHDSPPPVKTPVEPKEQHHLEDDRRMPQVDSTSRDSEDWHRRQNENDDPLNKHPGTVDLPADAEVSMRGPGWTTFDVPMEQAGVNEFQFSPLEDRQTSDSLNSEYTKYFGELDDAIAFEMPDLHVNCWLQSMMATTWGFSPSCNADGSYGPKQCHEKRCWCVDSNGQKIRHHGGKDNDGFYFGLQGLTLYCAEN